MEISKMKGHGQKEVVRIHPAVADEFQKATARLKEVEKESSRLAAQLAAEKKSRQSLGGRTVYVDDMPGKQLPFRYQINVPLVGGSSSPVTGTFNVSNDGPFVCRRLYASLIVTNAPRFEFAPIDITDYSYLIGRYVAASSREGYLSSFSGPGSLLLSNNSGWAYPVRVDGVGGSFFSELFSVLDFQWEYNDSGGKVSRQDKPISGDVLFRRDDDGYLMDNEVFAAGTTVNFIVSPTRPIPIIERFNTILDIAESGPVDVELQVTFDGFKILQPWVSWEL